jgi:hypothetical protein
MKDLLDRAIDRLVTLTAENSTLKEVNLNLLQFNLNLSTELNDYKTAASSTESSISKLTALLGDPEPAIEPSLDTNTSEVLAELPISPIETIEATFPTQDPALVPVQIDAPVSM